MVWSRHHFRFDFFFLHKLLTHDCSGRKKVQHCIFIAAVAALDDNKQ